jgi:diaminohydroxyphosphoribosylaminopyrimidine deaminase / 5-amino-6-(5-phosphoribosylamino)uracil reductase
MADTGKENIVQHDVKFMKKAISLAARGLARTSPNPAVGAVIVRDGEIIASGYHKKAGGNHAEVEALSMTGGRGRADDILYVTLEPCNHHGKTPPCTEAIIKSGIRNVVIGMSDPNPAVAGGGAEFLRKKGVRVKSGVLEAECRKLNEGWLKFVSTGRPFVIAKSALTLDGWSATSKGHSKWITNEESRNFVHRLRDKVDGVMVGVGTIFADDPSLTARLKNRKGKDPVRIIVDTHLRMPHNAKVFNPDSDSRTIVVVGDKTPQRQMRAFEREGVSIMPVPAKDGRIDLSALMDALGKMSIVNLLVEGGSEIMGSLMREKLIDKFYFFMAPKVLGGDDGIPMARGKGPERMDGSISLRNIVVKRFDNDTLITGYPEYNIIAPGSEPKTKGRKRQ